VHRPAAPIHTAASSPKLLHLPARPSSSGCCLIHLAATRLQLRHAQAARPRRSTTMRLRPGPAPTASSCGQLQACASATPRRALLRQALPASTSTPEGPARVDLCPGEPRRGELRRVRAGHRPRRATEDLGLAAGETRCGAAASSSVTRLLSTRGCRSPAWAAARRRRGWSDSMAFFGMGG
jgi:hypothetical protein